MHLFYKYSKIFVLSCAFYKARVIDRSFPLTKIAGQIIIIILLFSFFL